MLCFIGKGNIRKENNMRPYKSLFTESIVQDYDKFIKRFKTHIDYLEEPNDRSGIITSTVTAWSKQDLNQIKSYLDSNNIRYVQDINPVEMEIIWTPFNDKINEIVSKNQVKKIVDISNLEWGKTVLLSGKEAMSDFPSGWRLPTIQELYTAFISDVSGFNDDPNYGTYWSSSLPPIESRYDIWTVWVLNFTKGIFLSNRSYTNYVRYVK